MPKFSDFDRTNCDLVFTSGDEMYKVYFSHAHARYYLTRLGKNLAFKNNTEISPNYQKWIEKWRANAMNQLVSIHYRIEDLHKEEQEIKDMLGTTL